LPFLGGIVVGKAQSVDEQVKAAYAAWDDAFNKGDAKAVAAFYTDNATFLPATHDVV
jgi:ketosteroid isomerase-like protein